MSQQGSNSPAAATAATTRLTKVPLDEFVLITEDFCHRNADELTDPDKLRPLMDSLVAEGLQIPIEFARDAAGRPVPTKGHRRVTCLRLLARANTPGFTATMSVDAIEVSGATHQDLVVRSILDNVNRLSYSQVERFRAAKKLHEAGVNPQRAADALGVTIKTYKRDLLVAQNDWMLELITRHCVAATSGWQLLEAATKDGNSVNELQTHLMTWIDQTQRRLAAKSKKEALRPAEQLVKTHMTKPLVDHWIARLRKKESLDDAIPEPLKVHIDPEANTVSFQAAEIDLMNLSLPELTRCFTHVDTAKTVIFNYIKARHAMGASGPQEAARREVEKPSALAWLREQGFGGLADQAQQMAPADESTDPTDSMAAEDSLDSAAAI